MARASMLVISLFAWAAALVSADIMFPGYNEPDNFYHQHHHHHHPTPGRRPGHTTLRPEVPVLRNRIPDELLDSLNDVSSMDDFLKFVRRNTSYDLANRFGAEDDVEKKAISNFKFAKCEPEEQTIRLDIPEQNPLNMYMPQCVRVKRCGGCCLNSIHTCMPTQTSIVNYKIWGVQYRTGSQLDEKETKIVSVEVHNACKCMCKGSQSDCRENQKFDKSKCECTCNNKDDHRKCIQNSSELKQWDPKMCLCVCRNVRDCSTGQFFNPRTCSCEIERPRRPAESRRRRGEEGARTQTKMVLPLETEN